MAQIVTTIQLEETLVQQIEQWAETLNVSRDDLLAQAVEAFLHKQKQNQQLLDNINKVYAHREEGEDEEPLLQATLYEYRQIMDHDEW